MAVLAVCLTTASVSQAEFDPSFQFSGFGSLGYARITDNETVNYAVGLGSGGVNSDGAFTLDSRLAGQLNVIFTENFSATFQALSREDQLEKFDPKTEWAFLKYQFNNSYSLRAGRIALPIYSLSDYRQVGYAFDYVRPPEDLYAQVPLRNIDGVDLLADLSFGDYYINAQLYGGMTDTLVDKTLAAELTAFGLNLSVEYAMATVRLSHVKSRIFLDSPGLSELRSRLTQAAGFLPELEPIAADFNRGSRNNRSRVEWSSIGLKLNFDRFYLDAEYAIREDD